MLFIIALALAVCFVCFCDKPLKKHPAVFYVSASVITIVVIALSQTEIIRSMPEFLRNYVIALFSKGSLAAALWCIVMWAGAFPNGSAPIKKIMPIRGELSIFAAAVTLSHVVTYGITYIKTLTNNIKLDRDPTTEFIFTCIISIVLILIMLPLTVMSFKKIRKKMDAKLWKKIQRTAYLFYALIYAHIMVLYVPQAQRGMTDKYISIIIYSIVFIAYAAMRIRKALVKKNAEKSGMITAVCSASAVVLIALPVVFSYGKAPQRTQKTTTDNNSVSSETTTVPSLTSEVSGQEVVTTAADTNTADTTDKKSSKDTTTSGTGTTDTTTSGTGTTTTDKDETTDDETSDETSETETTPAEDEPENNEEQSEPEQQPEPEPATEPPTEPEPVYIYNNGTYSGTAYGYAGDITVTITIENDVITSISASADGDDPEYYDYAMDYILPQIQQNMTADVDAYSGATYSSQGLMDAARQALSQAVR